MPDDGTNDGVTNDGPLLRVRRLKKHFPVRSGVFGRIGAWVQAVDDISFEIAAGKTLGLVGESGSGKTTAGRTLLRLIAPTSGEVVFDGHFVFDLEGKELRALRRRMQIIFQDPYQSLNPRMSIGGIVGESLLIHGTRSRRERRDRVADLLRQVGLSPRHMDRYPHEFSGGQRQRIGIARAIALNPDFIVCDEAVSALDVSVQAQIINLLEDLQAQHNIAYLFIAHDLSVVRQISDEVAVMYLGKIFERAPTEALFEHPLHPYTEALLSAIPVPDPARGRKRIILGGEVPSPINPPSYCRYYDRDCPKRMPVCRREEPPLLEISPGRRVACFAAEGYPRESDAPGRTRPARPHGE